MNQMLDPQANPVRDQPYPTQLEHFHIDASQRTLQRAFAARKPRAGRYKMARIKPLSQKNQQLRMAYGKEHKDHTIENFWQYVHFTDEAHFDPDQTFEKRVLREEGTRYESENMQTMPSMKEVKSHIAVSISWHHKGVLQFYNDEHDMPEIQIKKPRKPRKRKHDTEDEYRQRVAEWEAALPHDVDIKPQGNSMTQAYYTSRLLPIYMSEIHECRLLHDRSCTLQEDNDPNHGTRSAVNIVRSCKARNWITVSCRNVTELKRIILEEWDKITMDEIRARIKEMPDRCKKVAIDGKAIKSDLW
jgi:hypothetical protein